MCSVVKAELRYGAERSRNPRKAFVELDEFLTPYRSLPFDDECAIVYGKIRARLAVLVTHNTREFSRVEGLSCEDWQL